MSKPPVYKNAWVVKGATVVKTEGYWFYVTLQERTVDGEERVEIQYNMAEHQKGRWKLKSHYPLAIYNYEERWKIFKQCTEDFLDNLGSFEIPRCFEGIPTYGEEEMFQYATVKKTLRWWALIVVKDRNENGRPKIYYRRAKWEGDRWEIDRNFPTLAYDHYERWEIYKNITSSFVKEIPKYLERRKLPKFLD